MRAATLAPRITELRTCSRARAPIRHMPVTSIASSKPDSSQSAVVGERDVHAEKSIKLVQVEYTDPLGKRRTWDAVRRTTTKRDSEADAVCVFATLKRAGAEDEVLLVRQFRPACGTETIELPAGLIDDGESAETSALRELKEECGYVGVVRGKTPAVVLSPGLSDESVVMVEVDVDADAEENKNVSQALEGSEFITVIRCPKSELLSALDAFSASGVRVFAGLYTVAWALARENL